MFARCFRPFIHAVRQGYEDDFKLQPDLMLATDSCDRGVAVRDPCRIEPVRRCANMQGIINK